MSYYFNAMLLSACGPRAKTAMSTTNQSVIVLEQDREFRDFTETH